MKHLRTLFTLVLASSLCSAQELPQGSTIHRPDLGKYFEGYNGGFVLYDFKNNEYSQYNPKMCSTRFTPCSTFKIPNSLIALETGVAPDTSFVIRYDSVKHPIDPAILKSEPFRHWP
ncbi:MAG TPA: penicillin-binding transpeptidase domain-containing protein, partial [Bacteroidota bacterium]